MALVALVKATASRLAREGAMLCREVMGGNGIVLENDVAKALADVEVRSADREQASKETCLQLSYPFLSFTFFLIPSGLVHL